MHIRRTHPGKRKKHNNKKPIISHWCLVWVGGSAGHPVHLTVHSITVAHKLHQEYQAAWAGCRLRMQPPPCRSPPPPSHFHSLPLLSLFSCRLSGQMPDCCLRDFGFLSIFSFLLFWSGLENANARARAHTRPQTNSLVAFNTHRWHTLINPLLFAPRRVNKCTMNACIDGRTPARQNLFCWWKPGGKKEKRNRGSSFETHQRAHKVALSVFPPSSLALLPPSLRGPHDSDGYSR